MGQYWKVCNLDTLETCKSKGGLKLMEHSYVGSPLTETVEKLLLQGNPWYNTRIVNTGDYDDEGSDIFIEGLYSTASDWTELLCNDDLNNKDINYIFNSKKKEYIDKRESPVCSFDMQIHPLFLLIANALANGSGGGDYRVRKEDEEHFGRWYGDPIFSIEGEIPENLKDYKKIQPNFLE